MKAQEELGVGWQIMGAVVVIALVVGFCWFCISANSTPSCGDGDHAWCVNGHEIRDDADQAIKDNQEADKKATQDAVTAVCAAMREAGNDAACTK